MYKIVPNFCRVKDKDGLQHFGKDALAVMAVVQWLIEVYDARVIRIEKMEIPYKIPREIFGEPPPKDPGVVE